MTSADESVRPKPPKGATLLDGHMDVPADRLAAVEAALAEAEKATARTGDDGNIGVGRGGGSAD